MKVTRVKAFCLFIVCVFLAGCAHSAARKDFSQQDIKEHIRKKLNFYQKKDKDKFFNDVSREYHGGYEDFRNQIENFLRANSSINIDFNIEKVLTSGQTKTVEARWFKTYVDRNGNPVERDGLAVLFFDISKGKIRLINIKGDNPFTR